MIEEGGSGIRKGKRQGDIDRDKKRELARGLLWGKEHYIYFGIMMKDDAKRKKLMEREILARCPRGERRKMHEIISF